MAITAKPFWAFLTGIAQGLHNLSTDDNNIALLTGSYAYDDAHNSYTQVQSAELPNDSATGGYQSGGQLLPKAAIAWNDATRTTILPSSGVTWDSLTGTVRYAVVYNINNLRLVGLIDFGSSTTYTAQPLQLSFPSGLVNITGS